MGNCTYNWMETLYNDVYLRVKLFNCHQFEWMGLFAEDQMVCLHFLLKTHKIQVAGMYYKTVLKGRVSVLASVKGTRGNYIGEDFVGF